MERFVSIDFEKQYRTNVSHLDSYASLKFSFADLLCSRTMKFVISCDIFTWISWEKRNFSVSSDLSNKVFRQTSNIAKFRLSHKETKDFLFLSERRFSSLEKNLIIDKDNLFQMKKFSFDFQFLLHRSFQQSINFSRTNQLNQISLFKQKLLIKVTSLMTKPTLHLSFQLEKKEKILSLKLIICSSVFLVDSNSSQ